MLQKGMGRVGVVPLGMEALRGGGEWQGALVRVEDGKGWGKRTFGGSMSAGSFLGTCEAGDEIIASRSCMAVFVRVVLVRIGMGYHIGIGSAYGVVRYGPGFLILRAFIRRSIVGREPRFEAVGVAKAVIIES